MPLSKRQADSADMTQSRKINQLFLLSKAVSFQFEKGKSYAIVGASGSGKSTLLQLLMGADENYTGSIYL